MSENNGFDVFMILLLLFGNALCMGLIIVPSFIFNSKILISIIVALVSILGGWITMSVGKKLDFSQAKAIWNMIISTSGGLLVITALLSLISLVAKVIQFKYAGANPATANSVPSLFMTFTLLEQILIGLIYIICFNVLFVKNRLLSREKSNLKLLYVGVVIWILIFSGVFFFSDIIFANMTA